MGKRIVFCADGTWQLPMQNTNVYRMFKALQVTAEQVTFYEDGIGSEASGLARMLQGGFGKGLLDKVLDGYTKIAHVFEPGDEIFLFGFSRGAYTARSLAGMIAACGLPGGHFDDAALANIFAAYRDPLHRSALLARVNGCGLADATLRMIGVWDTVGSLGIPAIFGDVENAYHALAIDEKRAQFPATLWTGEPADGQTIEQVWFSGCHCDVGGGTLPGGGVDDGTRLCDIALGWMMGKAHALGLTFDPATLQLMNALPARYALDRIRESWKPAAGAQHTRPIAEDAMVASSVAVRVQYGLSYAPANLKRSEDGTLADSYELIEVVDEDAL